MTTPAPSPDEVAGMTWWNGLTETERGRWLRAAGSSVPADARATYKRAQAHEAKAEAEAQRDHQPRGEQS